MEEEAEYFPCGTYIEIVLVKNKYDYNFQNLLVTKF